MKSTKQLLLLFCLVATWKPIMAGAAQWLSELDTEFWTTKGQSILNDRLNRVFNTNVAKNVILFLGDGMSVPTLAAARAFQANTRHQLIGEGEPLSFETFPYSGLSQTYCVDHQVADSACSATAYLCGVKGNLETIGVNAHIGRKDCAAMTNQLHHVDSIAQWFQDKGLSTGVVTTTSLTDASPAGVYAHTASRYWENDGDVTKDGADPKICRDIAYQLVNNSPGQNLNVIMGGGRSQFLPKSEGGVREDNRNLIDTWKTVKNSNQGEKRYVTSRDELLALRPPPTYLLGIFADDHLDDHIRNNKDQPTLAEMTEMAIKVLQNTGKGFFLFVEGGKIDLGHHANQAHVALDETVEFSKAIAVAKRMTNNNDTLIVVTADHAHTITYNGYAPRNVSILKFAGAGDDEKPYTILSYANGPGFKLQNGGRADLTNDDTESSGYVFPAGVPLGNETHGGDDVAVFADGPWAHLFSGSFEQNFIPSAMAYASCVGNGKTACMK